MVIMIAYYVPGTVLIVFAYILSFNLLIDPLRRVIIPVLQMRKLRHKVVKQLSNLPKWQTHAVNPGGQVSNHMAQLYHSCLFGDSYLLDYKIFVTNAHVLAVFKGVTTNGEAFHL